MSIIIPETHTEWLHERQNGLGASDAGTIIGVNPWKTNVQLWAEKTGQRQPEDISYKPYVQYGKAAEEHIRALFELDHPELAVSYESPYKIIRNDEATYAFCTPDGELTEKNSMNKGILEIKTTEIMNSRQWAEWNGRIPDQYYCQVVWQLMVTGWDFAYLVAQIKFTTRDGEKRKETREYRIDRSDVLEDIVCLKEEGAKFWKAVEERRCPPLKLPSI